MRKPVNYTTPAQLKAQIKAAKAQEKKYKAHLTLMKKLEVANEACNRALEALNDHPIARTYQKSLEHYYDDLPVVLTQSDFPKASNG